MKKDHFGFAVTSLIIADINTIPFLFVVLYASFEEAYHDNPAASVPLGYFLIFYILVCGLALFIVSVVFGIIGIVTSTRKVTKRLSIAALIIDAAPIVFVLIAYITNIIGAALTGVTSAG